MQERLLLITGRWTLYNRRVVRNRVYQNSRGARRSYLAPCRPSHDIVRNVDPLNRLEQVLVLGDPIANLPTPSIDLLQLIDVVLIGAQSPMVNVLDATAIIRSDNPSWLSIGNVWELGLVQAEKFLPVRSNDLVSGL